MNEQEEKWYDNEMLLDILIFVIPPVGIYGIYKTKRIKKSFFKISYAIIAFFSIIIFIIDYYKS